MGFWEGVGEIFVTAAVMQDGKATVQQLVNYRQDRACAALDKLAHSIVANRNLPLAQAVLEEFGNQLQAADSRDFQNDVNDLLWYFKAAVHFANGHRA
jgi:hypothetical protein